MGAGIKMSRSMTIAVLGLLLLLFIGCGKKTSTLPPVSQETKAAETAPAPTIEPQPEPVDTTPRGWVIRDLINVRAKPATTADVVAQLSRGAEVQLVELSDKWWTVLLNDGRTAYIFESLLTREPYVDPWTRFRMEAGRAHTLLELVTAVAGIDGDAPSAALTVADGWSELSTEEKQEFGVAALDFWSSCLRKCGFDPAKAVIVIRNSTAVEIGRVTLVGGKPQTTLN